MHLPEGIHPNEVPSRERLDSLSEDDLFQIIHYHQDRNFVLQGTQFWIDELSRRRTHGVLEQIARAAEREATHGAKLARLTAEAADENARTANLNQEMRDLTRRMFWLTVVNVVLAAAALGVALGALRNSG